MWHNFATLLRYRGLIQSLVARELKARYRGSVLGFFWSFVNPLLLLSIYSFVFAVIMPPADPEGRDQPVRGVMFCGLLPWTWFSASLLEGSGALISGWQPDQEGPVPAEILPIVSVLANMVHFLLGLLIPRGLHGLEPALPRLERQCVVSSDCPVPADFHARAGAAPGCAHRALPRSQGPAGQPADVLVLLRRRSSIPTRWITSPEFAEPVRLESFLPFRGVVPGSAVLSRRVRRTSNGCR
jgi:hypothetical protein